jgi:hypothetical protein
MKSETVADQLCALETATFEVLEITDVTEDVAAWSSCSTSSCCSTSSSSCGSTSSCSCSCQSTSSCA